MLPEASIAPAGWTSSGLRAPHKRQMGQRARFTFFTENFVIRCDQVTRSAHDCTSTSSARRPRNFSLQADIAIWVLRKVRAGFHRGSKGLLSSTKFSLNSCSQSGNSCNRSHCTSSRPSFLLVFSVSVDLCIVFPRRSSLVLPLLSGTGFSA